MRSRYWSCSKLSEKILGVKKPMALTSDGWDSWRREMKKERPIRFWLSNSALDALQNLVFWIPDQYQRLRVYFMNRFISKSHCLTSNKQLISPGSWCELGDRIAPCVFSELVDFVEIDLAQNYMFWFNEESKAFKPEKKIFGKWRCPEAGIASLKLKMTSNRGNSGECHVKHKESRVPTHSAIIAREILELYTWTKEEYFSDSHNDFTIVDEKLEDNKKTETEMLIKLIKIRKYLYT